MNLCVTVGLGDKMRHLSCTYPPGECPAGQRVTAEKSGRMVRAGEAVCATPTGSNPAQLDGTEEQG